MATTQLNNLILRLARRLQDARSSASSSSDSGARFTSAMLTDYVNKGMKAFIQQMLEKLGASGFQIALPEFVKQSAILTLSSAGIVAKPTDAFMVLDLRKSDNSLKYQRLEPARVASILISGDPMVLPSATHPIFWEENGFINVLPAASAIVYARYIKIPTELAVGLTATTSGNWNASGTMTFTLATMQLEVTNPYGVFSADDIGKRIFLRDAGKVYTGTISGFISTTKVTLAGDDLPTGVTTTIVQVMVSDYLPDMEASTIWHPIIEDFAFRIAQGDITMTLSEGK